jgi:hypothetical protein
LIAGLKRFYSLILVVITLSVGVTILISFAVESEMLRQLRTVFAEWTIIVTAFALLLGVLNVLRVHGRRIQEGEGVLYSLLLIASFLVVFVPGILSSSGVPEHVSNLVGPTGAIVDFAFRYVQRPLQATIFSLMGFFVITAAWRAFRVRSASSLIMFLAALLVLLGSIQLGAGSGWRVLSEIRNWVLDVPTLAGTRGILLGIVLGTIVAGMRLLIGIDRPYSD